MERELIRSKNARKVTLVGFVVNTILTIFKLAAGIIGKSSAMVADSIHSLSDSLTDIVVLVGFKLASRPEDECHNYGHDKYETLATVIIGFALALAGYQVLKSGTVKIIAVARGGSLSRPGIITLIAAIISIISKELLYRYTAAAGKRINSPSVTANAWHHRSDAFSSIGTMIGIGGAIILNQRWAILDPIASIVVSLFIFKVAYDIFKPSINELVEKSLDRKTRQEVEEVFHEFRGVKDYHELRMRKVGTKAVIESHILVDDNLNIKDAHDIAAGIENKIMDLVGEDSIITIHIEPYL
ncbi:MAG TPA: cation diffusion facilitator family transporter [Clostridia bacterium]|nr:cation diffusion facilitator family transporter [Clostridia bacterium]